MQSPSAHNILKFFTSHLTLLETKQLHVAIITSSLSHDPYLATKLLRSYAIHHDLPSARHIFDGVPSRNIYLWNSMIRAYSMNHDLGNAVTLFSLMRNSDTKPDGHTFACILHAFAEGVNIVQTRVIHGCMILSGLWLDPVACSALVSCYSKLGLFAEAGVVFDKMPDPDLVLCNAMLSGCGYRGSWQKGLEVFHRMRYCGAKLDSFSLVGVISCLRHSNLLPISRALHGLCLKAGFDSGDHVRSALVSMYTRCKCLDSALWVFNGLAQPDLVTWSALISGFAQAGKCAEALALFSRMSFLEQRLDPVLVASILSACASIVAIRPGREIHGYALRLGFHFDVSVSCALINMYVKCGFGQLGLLIFWMMPRRTTTAYNIIILGLGSLGFANRAMELFDDMLAEGLKPDKATFSALICGCCHSALLEEARLLFRRMRDEFGIVPQIEHYVYMVRLLGTVGELQEAYELIMTMPIKPDSGVWGAMLWGCNTRGNLELGRIAANHLFEMEPDKTAYKVMLSNMYALEGRWKDAENLRYEMTENGMRKSPGLSWVGVPGDDGSWNTNFEACG